MKTKKNKLNASRLIQAGIFCGLLLISLAVSANDSHSDNDESKKTNETSKPSRIELPPQSTWSTVEEEEDVKLENWMYNTEDPLWKSVMESGEKVSSEEEIEVEAWMTEPKSWTTI